MADSFRIRSEGREVEFKTLEEIQRALNVGLVDLTDEVRFPESEIWETVRTAPGLRKTRPGILKRWWKPLAQAALAVVSPLLYFVVRDSGRNWKGETWSPPRRKP